MIRELFGLGEYIQTLSSGNPLERVRIFDDVFAEDVNLFQ